MNNSIKRTSLLLASVAMTAVVAHVLVPQSDSNVMCSGVATYDNNLPASHPNNVCASHTESDVSWGNWLVGNSQSGQFHFLDLLELISRHTSDAQPAKTSPGP
ncbi:hypothetical protein [Bowmanella sp. JS7-9]|uniref:Uncharacterized protein n=1 Tax=Pseudobowmanella zhangzhouensis TaxID=1537679 RepID=A0ABW1XEW9_9ALTE|nr:hypothetical protein [Bowmanella sp. JS7-9]TBX20771.1 hypothetical protein TK45_13355 [Bowmanella sp. JS7-9]